MTKITKNETYKIIGACMEVHSQLGPGFLEVVYKEALEIEFHKRNIPFQREKEFQVNYKGVILEHKFFVDFMVYETLILEIKGTQGLNDLHLAQTINYLKVTCNNLALLINFGEERLNYKRVIY